MSGSAAALLSVQDLSVQFASGDGVVKAVSEVSLDVGACETIGIVGESGCGKSTLAKAIMRLHPASSGRIAVQGQDITDLSLDALRPVRPLVQMIFQDPYHSLNPRHTVGKIIGRPLEVARWRRADIAERVHVLMNQVGLPADAYHRYPHEFSGGQRQRIGIARALALQPRLLICDEPVSALDVSIRAQVMNLLQDLKEQLGISFLFISHDLSMIRHFSDRLLVMYLGRVVETGSAEALWRNPAHPYTKALMATAPIANPKAARARQRVTLEGDLPSPLNLPPGCSFAGRCAFAAPLCHAQRPDLRAGPDGRRFACHFDLWDVPFGAMPAPVSPMPASKEITHAVE